jgi:hypothetical protein
VLTSNIKVNEAAQFFCDNKLKLNSEKTQFMCIQTQQRSNSKFSHNPTIQIDKTELEPVNMVDFLEVRLDGGLDWGGQLDKIESKLARGVFVLQNLSKFQNIKLLMTVYFCLLQSYISYSIILWGTTDSKLKQFFVWQKKAIRGMLRLPKSAH